MTMYVKVLEEITVSFGNDDDDTEYHLDSRSPYKILPVWVAQSTGFQRLWTRGQVQVATDSGFINLVTEVPSSELLGATGYDTASTTMYNKRVVRRVLTVTNVDSWTIDSDSCDHAENLDIDGPVTLNNPSGTPNRNQLLWVSMEGTGAWNVLYGTDFEDSSIHRPPALPADDRVDIGFLWNARSAKWRCVAVA